ncbi:MAG: hypothetical protein ACP5TY_07135 [Thermodesulforhabdaceae bacterium]|jgi:uncharacterized membrane protein YidH (DUF202 family)
MSDNRIIEKFSDLFSAEERKELFKKYLYFLGWLELLIFVGCWIYQLGSENYDRTGVAVDIPFPWRAYFTISFLAPILITFVIGVIIAAFNRYLIDKKPDEQVAPEEENINLSARQHRVARIVKQLQHVPFLGLLLLLGLGVVALYNLDTIITIIGTVGEKTVKISIIFIVAILALISIFAMVLIILNYKLRKRSMEYRFRSEMAERFGLIILEDNTVLNHEGKLLVQGKKWKKALPDLQASKRDKKGKDDSKAITKYGKFPPDVSPESAD